MDKIKEIKDFLNVSIDDIRKLPPKVITDMEKAVELEDYFKLHHLGYELTINR